MDDAAARSAVAAAWAGYGDPRGIDAIEETSAHVSTNRVYRLHLDDGTTVMAKASSYGSYFLFAEDHDRLSEVATFLTGTRWSGFLAGILQRDGRPYRWYDGTCWVVLYVDVPRGESLPRTLQTSDVECLAREVAEFHLACAEVSSHLPPPSHSVKSDALALLASVSDMSEPGGEADGGADAISRSAHELLVHLDRIDFDHWPRIPILVDWNLGNFSVQRDGHGGFRLHSRWDYDWFRIDSRLLDFYFLSRVSSATGDRTAFTYSPHTLFEDRFSAFLRSYHRVFPLTREEVLFLPWAYRFFVLNYVVREGRRFFRPDLAARFRREAVGTYLPGAGSLDATPIADALGLA